jgi:hypothetical protein
LNDAQVNDDDDETVNVIDEKSIDDDNFLNESEFYKPTEKENENDETHNFNKIDFPFAQNLYLKKHINSKTSSYYKARNKAMDTETESECESTDNILSDANDSLKLNNLTRITPSLNVKDPSFVIRPQDRVVRIGEPARFMSKIIGSKPLAVFWYKLNGDELQNNEKYEIYHDDEYYYLKIYNTVHRDTGMYFCVIANDINQNVDSFQLSIRSN